MENHLTENARYLLLSVFRFSANASCKESARKIILANITGDDAAFEREVKYAGDFMKECIKGDMVQAWFRGDPMNRLAIELGWKDIVETRKMWNEGYDPKEFQDGGK
jgi:hypothetical protein